MSPQKPTRSLGSVLITGGCGFLGHHLVSQLLESYDARISVLDLRTDRNRFPGVSYHNGDITSETAVYKILEEVRPDVIIHTASPVPFDDSAPNNELYRRVNVDGTRNLLDVAARVGCVKAFVYTSSASVVHDTVSDLVNADESWPVLHAPQQREYYSETKAWAEELVLAANRKHGDMLTVAIRPAGVFGEADRQMIPNMLRAYHKGQTGFQLGKNENLYDFTYVGNVVHGHILAAAALLDAHGQSPRSGDHEKVDGEAFFITNGTPVYFWDFARTVWKAAGDKTEPSQVWVIEKRFGLALASVIEWVWWAIGGWKPNLTRKSVNHSSMTRYYNISKARRVLGYEPLFGLEDSVIKTVQWFEQRRKEEEIQTGATNS